MSTQGEARHQRIGLTRGHQREGARQRHDAPGSHRARHEAMDLILSDTGVLRQQGNRVIVMTEHAYILLLQVIHEHAPEILKYAFYDMGYRVGVDLLAGVSDYADGPQEAFTHFIAQYMQAGYGELTITHFDMEAPEAQLTGHHLFEATIAPQTNVYRSPRAVDHYSRGIFAGFMSALLQREVICEEIACEVRGDPACEFVVLPFQH